MRFLLIAALLLTGCTANRYNIPAATAKITNLAGNSGGSGSVVFHSPELSLVLTNGHVCSVIEEGGIIQTPQRAAFAVKYVKSKVHDLCVISVSSDLGASVSLSDSPPLPFENATVSGHPHLLPTIITKGYFSGKQVTQVMTGSRECTQEEKEDPTLGFFCAIIGRLPVVKIYETMVTSATIQPGSSGSAVYGEDGKIKAVIFAGTGDFAYGVAVPFEYVHTFMTEEIYDLQSISVNNVVSFVPTANDRSSKTSFKSQMIEACSSDNLTPQQKDVCSYFLSSFSADNLIYTRVK